MKELVIVVLPRRLARFNRVATNRVAGRVADRLPGFGIVEHTGRRSGRSHRTPVNVFRTGDGYVLALTYGPSTDWVKNVLAGAGCVLHTRGRRIRLTEPRIVHDATRADMPPGVRQILSAVGVSDFLYLKRTA
jgi:deazaflavin-dependent oxidoreductase (nitroreductase family)